MRFGNTLLKSKTLEGFSFLPHPMVNIPNIEYLVNAVDLIKTVERVFFDLSQLQMPFGLFQHLCQKNKQYDESTFFLNFALDFNSEKVIKAMQQCTMRKNMIITNARVVMNINMERFRLNIVAELFALLSSLCGVRNISLCINLHD
jgi:hypothetical protein